MIGRDLLEIYNFIRNDEAFMDKPWGGIIQTYEDDHHIYGRTLHCSCLALYALGLCDFEIMPPGRGEGRSYCWIATITARKEMFVPPKYDFITMMDVSYVFDVLILGRKNLFPKEIMGKMKMELCKNFIKSIMRINKKSDMEKILSKGESNESG